MVKVPETGQSKSASHLQNHADKMQTSFKVEKKELGSRAKLEDVVIQAAFANENGAINPEILEIDLGQYGDLARQLVTETISDPKKREKHAFLWVKQPGDRPAFMWSQRSKNIGGKTFSIPIPNFLNILNPQIKVASSLHSHPFEFPPSSQDLANLFTLHGSANEVFTFVSCENRKEERQGNMWLVFRGNNTPDFTFREARKALRETSEEIYGMPQPEPKSLVIDAVQSIVQSKKQAENMLEEGREAHSRSWQEYWLMKLAEKYDLKVFHVEAGENVAKKVDLVRP